MRRPLAALAAALAIPTVATAQSTGIGQDFADILKDAWFIAESPARASGDDLRTAAILAGATGTLLLVDEPVHEWLRDNPDSPVARALAPFGESSALNLLGRTRQFLLPFSGLLYAGGLAFDSRDLRDAGLGCATSNLTTTLTRRTVSTVLGRLRPEGDRGAFEFELFGGVGNWQMRSFPGGHSANVFSCASFFNHRFDLGAADPVIWATAGAVGAARVVDEAHWLSDTVAGAAFGWSVGRGVAHRFRGREAERAAGEPVAERSMEPAIGIGWRIRF